MSYFKERCDSVRHATNMRLKALFGKRTKGNKDYNDIERWKKCAGNIQDGEGQGSEESYLKVGCLGTYLDHMR